MNPEIIYIEDPLPLPQHPPDYIDPREDPNSPEYIVSDKQRAKIV